MLVLGKVVILSFDAEFSVLVGNLSNIVITVHINWFPSILGLFFGH